MAFKPKNTTPKPSAKVAQTAKKPAQKPAKPFPFSAGGMAKGKKC